MPTAATIATETYPDPRISTAAGTKLSDPTSSSRMEAFNGGHTAKPAAALPAACASIVPHHLQPVQLSTTQKNRAVYGAAFVPPPFILLLRRMRSPSKGPRSPRQLSPRPVAKPPPKGLPRKRSASIMSHGVRMRRCAGKPTANAMPERIAVRIACKAGFSRQAGAQGATIASPG